ncbi:unnamed protein product [Trichobilharzia regenti]|nr:unnamed protein product [Trichobilharzia regenti]
MAYETTKIQISGKQTTPEGIQKKEIGIIKMPLFSLGEEIEDDSRIRMKGKQYISESATENIFDDTTIFPVRSHLGAMMVTGSHLPFIIARAPTQSVPIQPTSFAVRFAQKPPKRRMLGKRAKVTQSLSPIESSKHSPHVKFTQDTTHKPVGLMGLEPKSMSESTPTQEIHGMYKTLSDDEAKHTLWPDIQTLKFTYQKDSEKKTIGVWTWFDRILASKPVPLSSTEGMIKTQTRKNRKALLSSSKTPYKVDEQSEQTTSEIEKLDSESIESYEKIFQYRYTGATFDFKGKFRIPKWLEQRLYEDLGNSLSTGIKIQEKDTSSLPPMIPTRSHGSMIKMKKLKEPSPNKMKQFRNDLQIAVSHLKYILHPQQLTRLLIEIKSEIPTLETIKLFEKLLLQAAQKARDAKHM